MYASKNKYGGQVVTLGRMVLYVAPATAGSGFRPAHGSSGDVVRGESGYMVPATVAGIENRHNYVTGVDSEYVKIVTVYGNEHTPAFTDVKTVDDLDAAMRDATAPFWCWPPRV